MEGARVGYFQGLGRSSFEGPRKGEVAGRGQGDFRAGWRPGGGSEGLRAGDPAQEGEGGSSPSTDEAPLLGRRLHGEEGMSNEPTMRTF